MASLEHLRNDGLGQMDGSHHSNLEGLPDQLGLEIEEVSPPKATGIIRYSRYGSELTADFTYRLKHAGSLRNVNRKRDGFASTRADLVCDGLGRLGAAGEEANRVAFSAEGSR